MHVAAPSSASSPRRVITWVAMAALAAMGIGVAAQLASARSHRCGRAAVPFVYAVTPPSTTAPTAGCTTPVVGLWVAHEFRPERGDWVEHELHIVDDDGKYLVGHVSRVRDGNADGPTTFHCLPDAHEYETRGGATLDGDQLHVFGASLVESRARCDGKLHEYSLDSWTGRLDGDHFDSVNNDGSTAQNRPYRFRRIACE